MMEIRSVKRLSNGQLSIIDESGNVFDCDEKGDSNIHVSLSEWLSDGGGIEPHVPLLSDLKNEALQTLKQQHAEILRTLSGNATVEERDTWQAKAIAAKLFIVGGADTSQIEMLTIEATMNSEAVADHAATIVFKSGLYHKMIGISAGHRRATETAINNAADIPDLVSILDAAKTKSGELITAFLSGV